MYVILNICFKVSRYLESYYRYVDLLAVNNKLTETLQISTSFAWVSKLAKKVKRDLEEHALPPTSTYKDSLDLILNNPGVVMENIERFRSDPSSSQSENTNRLHMMEEIKTIRGSLQSIEIS